MEAQLRYKGFEPGDAVKDEASEVLAQLSNLEIDHSTMVARVEFDGSEYGCSIDVFGEFGSEYVFITHENPVTAIRGATERLKRKLLRSRAAKRCFGLRFDKNGISSHL